MEPIRRGSEGFRDEVNGLVLLLVSVGMKPHEIRADGHHVGITSIG